MYIYIYTSISDENRTNSLFEKLLEIEEEIISDENQPDVDLNMFELLIISTQNY